MERDPCTHVAPPAELPEGAGELGWEDLGGLHSDAAEALMDLGRRLGQTGQLRQALCLFEEVVRLAPGDPMAHTARGTALQALGEYERARRGYEKALQLVEGHVPALVARGELRLRRGDDGGLADLRGAARVDPRGLTPGGRRAAQRLREARAAGWAPAVPPPLTSTATSPDP